MLSPVRKASGARGAAQPHARCRVCGGRDLVRYLDMGATPLANSYLSGDQLAEPELTVELAIQLCGACGLSQLTMVVDPDLMFRQYLYVSSTTRTFRDHCAELAATVARVAGARPGDGVLDIASNDGLLLSCFQANGLRVLGVDPARNLAAEATARGIPTLADYWGPEVARAAIDRSGRPVAITATNVLAHVDDLDRFISAVGIALADRGIFVVEVPYVVDLVERNAFDTAYHEHLSYFGVTPMLRLFRTHRLEVFDVERFPDIHGGTIRVFACRAGDRAPSARVGTILDAEQAFGIADAGVYLRFGERTRANLEVLRDVVGRLRAGGHEIWAYGASAKGNTLMNWSGLTADLVPVAVDDNPKKWGLYTPGARMRITGPDELARSRADHLLLLAWNFEREIVRRSRSAGYRGAYIRPVPEVEVFA